jgi:uncharacterized protein (DUF2235 family)
MSKRIILLLDGTWNDADSGPADTNIVRLREIISDCMDDARPMKVDILSPGSESIRTSISTGTFNNKEHLIFYERGVGTGGFLDLYFGGAFGTGLSRNIRRAYRFLSEKYADGDEVFIFGFSRGSYTARSLAGYIAAVGLIYSKFCTEENESRAWYFYRQRPADRIRTALGDLPARPINLQCLGVFETVGALGVPLPFFRRENRDLFEFHDVGLSNAASLNLHALAIDEHRLSFEPTLWRQPAFGPTSGDVEQVWFAGAHSDVGGGYIDQDLRQTRSIPALDDITLDWMLKRVTARYVNFPVRRNGSQHWPKVPKGSSLAPQHEPRSGLYKTLPLALRSINNILVPLRFHQSNVGRDRHAKTVGEGVHQSVFERLGSVVQMGNRVGYYAPVNLLVALKAIQSSFNTSHPVHVVDDNGHFVTAQAANILLTSARQRLQAAGLLKS